MTGAAGAAVLFDLDGVLADSRRAITSCMNAALVAVGQAPRPIAELELLPGLAIHVERKSVTVAAALAALGDVVGAMVGDRDVDMVAAHAHGLPAVGAL